MKIYSKTHTITALASIALVLALDARGRPVSKTAVIDHPAGTVLDMDDADAQDLIDRGFAVEYKDSETKADDKGRVVIERVQMQTSLPEGATQPTVVRQDETFNDGPNNGGREGAKVHFDTKDAAAIDREKQALLDASKAAALAGNAPTAGTAETGKKTT